MQKIRVDFINQNVNFHFGDDVFWIRWTLIAFAFMVLFVLLFFIGKINKGKKDGLITKVKSDLKRYYVSVIVYISTIAVYYLRKFIVIDDNTIIYKFAETINNLESIVIIGLGMFLLTGFRYKNKNTYYKYLMKVLSVIEMVYIVTYYLTDRVELTQWFNWVGVLVFGGVFVVLSKFEMINTKEAEDDVFAPVTKYEILYENRKWMADRIISIIENKSIQMGYSVCISGEWGMGKTSLVNGLIEEVKRRKNKEIEIIRINSMELDDKTTLIGYLFKCIAQIFKKHYIYIGIASEYKKLISSIAGTLVNSGVENFIAQKLNESSDDYRDKIDALNILLRGHLKDTRIIIVVDDLDRCSSEKAREFLFIMKEIATLDNCVTLFSIDHTKLEKQLGVGEEFLDKFFNYKFFLATVDYEEILNQVYVESGHIIKEVIEDILKGLEENANTNKEHLMDYGEMKREFKRSISNPRHLNAVCDNYRRLDTLIANEKEKFPESLERIKEYLEKIKYERQIAILSIIYGVYLKEYSLLECFGIDNYIRRIGKNSLISHNERVVHVIVEKNWYFDNRHMGTDIKTFVQHLLRGELDLDIISNPYTDEDQRCLGDIEKGIKPLPLYDMILLISRIPKIKSEERQEWFVKVFKVFLEYLNKNTAGEVDEAFEIFRQDLEVPRLKHATPFMKVFAKEICNDNCYINETMKIKREFRDFLSNYLVYQLIDISNYLYASLPRDENPTVGWEELQRRLMSAVGWDIVYIFCEAMERIFECDNTKKNIDNISRLKEIIYTVNEVHRKEELAKYLDVKMDKERVDVLVEEIESAHKINEFIDNKNISTGDYVVDSKLSNQNMSFAIEHYYSERENLAIGKLTEGMQQILAYIYNEKYEISSDDYQKLEDITECRCQRTGSTDGAFWRQNLRYIKNKLIRKS